jgi:hypothetical protein
VFRLQHLLQAIRPRVEVGRWRLCNMLAAGSRGDGLSALRPHPHGPAIRPVPAEDVVLYALPARGFKQAVDA